MLACRFLMSPGGPAETGGGPSATCAGGCPQTLRRAATTNCGRSTFLDCGPIRGCSCITHCMVTQTCRKTAEGFVSAYSGPAHSLGWDSLQYFEYGRTLQCSCCIGQMHWALPQFGAICQLVAALSNNLQSTCSCWQM